MKKIIFLIVSLITILIIAILILWFFRINLINYFLSKDFGVPVAIQNIELEKNKLTVSGFEIKNPHSSHSELALSTNSIVFESTWQKLRSETLTIDKIQANDTLIVVELFNKKGDKNNWSAILAHDGNNSKKSKPYLIKTLILNKLRVRLIQSNGKTKEFPAINQMVFHNISDATGFPVDEKRRRNVLHLEVHVPQHQ